MWWAYSWAVIVAAVAAAATLIVAGVPVNVAGAAGIIAVNTVIVVGIPVRVEVSNT